MAPTTRSSAKKTAVTDAKDIISWTSAATGEELYYERFHAYEDEGEVLFVQMRMNEHGELVPWTTKDEDADKGSAIPDADDFSEEAEVDPDFVPKSEEVEVDPDLIPEAPRTQRRHPTKVNKTVPLPAASYHAQTQPVSSPSALYFGPAFNPLLRQAPSAAHLDRFVTQLVASCLPADRFPADRFPADRFPNDVVNDMAELMEGEFVLDLLVGPLSESVLRRTSQRTLPSLLRNFWVSDLSEINGGRAHAVEKEAYDLVRPGKVINGRWVLDPRNNIFRPTNPEYKALARMGP